METRPVRIALRSWAVLVMLFLYIPVGIIFLYAFNPSVLQAWPITGPLDALVRPGPARLGDPVGVLALAQGGIASRR